MMPVMTFPIGLFMMANKQQDELEMTLQELKQLIADSQDHLMIIELLNITPEDLVEAFSDRIEENHDKLVNELLVEDAIVEDN